MVTAKEIDTKKRALKYACQLEPRKRPLLLIYEETCSQVR